MQQQPTNEHISVLASEWDILATIEDNIKLLAHQNAKVQFEFIPSHQDDDTSYDNLSPKAKSNVDADHLATQFQEDHIHDERNVVPMLPKAGLQLHLPVTKTDSKAELSRTNSNILFDSPTPLPPYDSTYSNATSGQTKFSIRG